MWRSDSDIFKKYEVEEKGIIEIHCSYIWIKGECILGNSSDGRKCNHETNSAMIKTKETSGNR